MGFAIGKIDPGAFQEVSGGIISPETITDVAKLQMPENKLSHYLTDFL